MADKKLSQESALTKSTVDSSDLVYVADISASTTKKMTYGEMMSPQDNNFRIAGSADNTKLVAFEVDGLTTATTRTLTVPDANTTIVGTDTAQTLSNKTLTAPQIDMGGDATGDIYYRTSGGSFARLPIGSAGQIIQVSALGIPEYVANPAASDASASAKGVVEMATAAEITAGTASGSTGALLAIGPDQLALSAPTFSGANLTALPVSSYVGAVTSNTSTTTQNFDTTFTTGFLPKTITLYFKLKGIGSSAAKYTAGTATFNGTTLVGAFTLIRDQTTTEQFTNTLLGVSSTALTAGISGGIDTLVTLSVLSVSSTNFVVRTAYIADGNSGTADYYAVATR